MSISNIIKQRLNISDDKSIMDLKISNDKTNIENIIIFLLKLSLNYKTSDEFGQYLQNIFNRIYNNSNRKIKKLFESKIQDEKIKLILDKLFYLFSFVLLIISPGELLEYEYKVDEDFDINKEEEIDIKNTENFKKLKIIYEEYIKELEKNNISNKELIYYNGNISLHEENDEFSKYEKQINENDIKIDEKTEEESDEFVKTCYDEIIQKINDIYNNNINIYQIYLFF